GALLQLSVFALGIMPYITASITGLTIDPTPVHLDVHPITCSLGLPTRHFDVRFVVHAPEGAEPVRSHESDDLRWWPLSELPPDTEDLLPMIAAATWREGIGA
ncbi:hypothetical protein ACFQ1S_10745, partial [Kibdelosporangium lantanae]